MISAVVLTKNEEKNIKRCLKTLKWCDEVIVVDDFSEDSTLEIARKFRVKIYQRKLNNNFSAQRNFGLRKATQKWVLFVDADEQVPPTLRTEVKREIKKGRCEGFYLKRKDFVFGKWLTHGETGRVKLLRLAKKKAGRWTRKVDEVWEIKGKTATLKNPLEHFPHPTVSEFLKSINFYSSLNARQLYEEKKRTCLWDWGKPLAKFI